MADILTTRGTIQTLLSSELDSLANNSNAVHSTNVTFTSAGFLRAELELVASYSVAPTANTCVLVWLLREVDSTNYEDGGASVTPGRPPDAVFPLRSVTGAQRIIVLIDLPPGAVKPLLRNDGTGQAMASSGNTLKVRPFTQSI